MSVLKPTPLVIHLLQQGHTYSNSVTPSNSATPWAEYIETITDGLVYFMLGYQNTLKKSAEGRNGLL